MAQVTDFTVGANPSGFDMRTELNSIIVAITTENSGASEPLNPFAYMHWIDTSNATYYYIKQRNHTNDAWVSLWRYTVATKVIEPLSGGNPITFDLSNAIHIATTKATPVDADEFALSDSDASFGLKKLTWANLKATILSSFGVMISTATDKATPVDADMFILADSAATNATKKVTWVNFKSVLKDYFDTLYLITSTNTVKGIDYKGLLAEYEVTGSARTSIDFSGLDINTHKSYRVELDLINVSGSGLIYMFINNDTTITNYYSELGQFNATTISASRQNSPLICGMEAATSILKASGNISIINGFQTSTFVSTRSVSTLLQCFFSSVAKTLSITNITQLTFTSSATNSIGIGSKIRIYRGDV